MFNIFEVMKYPANNDECYQFDIVDELTIEKFEEEDPKLPQEACTIHSNSTTMANSARKEHVHYLEATTQILNARRRRFEELWKSSTSLILSIQEAPKLKLKDCLHI